MVLGSYVAICFFQFRNTCVNAAGSVTAAGCYDVRDPLDVAVVAAAAVGGLIGFLWWNAHPARIMMGDTGSLALGGLIAGLSVLTRTELLLIVIAGAVRGGDAVGGDPDRRLQGPQASGSSGWRPSTTTSSCPAGPRPR